MSALPTKKIGSDDVVAIGLGLMGLFGVYGQVESDEERLQFLDAALAHGATLWDSADVYADSEDLLGKWFKRTGNRNKIFLATKFGIIRKQGGTGIKGDPEYVKEACTRSLDRLGINQIDLYYLHRADKTVPIEKTIGAMAELVKEGKVRYLGLSEISSSTLRRAHAVHPIAAVQVEYSPFTLDIEDEKTNLLKTCRELGIAVIAYSPLGRGLLTGQFKSPDDFGEGDARKYFPRFSKENFPKILQLVDGLAEIAKNHGATAGQIALAWVSAQGEDVIPIPGTKNIKYLRENLASINVKLSVDEVGTIRRLATESDIGQTLRYPPQMMAHLFSDTPPL